MRKQVLLLTTVAGILICGGFAASAQAPGFAATPESQQGFTIQPRPGGTPEDDDQAGFSGYHGMMRPGMMGHGMVGGGYGNHDRSRGHEIMGPMMMRIIFSLMDADGDGKLTPQEWQAAHERIFKAMDTGHDGTVTLEEMEAFMHGITGPASPAQ